MSEVNATLMGAANAAHCENPEDDDFSFEAEIGLAAAHVLSVNIRESWFCKAAYPTTGADSSLVFDLRDGRTIQLDDLFRKDLAPGRLAAVLFPYELSRTRDRGTAKASEGEGNECTDVWAEELAEANLGVHFRLVGDGLVVRLDLPHVVAACANDVTVPFAALASIAAPDGPLAPLVAAHRGKPVIYRIHEPAMAPGENFPYTPPAR
jgi:hypothetical protein